MSPRRRTATVLFLDIVSSTRIASELGDARFRELLARFNRTVRTDLRRFGGREEDHAGDGFFATFDEPARAIGCASLLSEHVRELGIEIRSGIHTGETEQVDGKTQGIAVVIDARVMSLAGAGEVLVTSTTKELSTGSRFGFEDFSAHELKGVPGTWQVWAVRAVDGDPRPEPLPPGEAAERLRAIGAGPAGEGSPRRRIVIGVVVLAVVAVGIALLLPRREAESPPPESGAPRAGELLEISPSGSVMSTLLVEPLQAEGTVRHTVHPLVVGQGGVWLIRRDQLIHIDPIDDEVRGRPQLGSGNPLSINVATGYDAIWLMTEVELFRVHPGNDEARVVLRLGEGTVQGAKNTDVAAGAGSIWIGSTDGFLIRIDRRTERVERADGLDPIDSLAASSDAVWTGDPLAGAVTRYEPDSLRPVETIHVPGGVDALAIAGDRVWVLSRSVGQVTEVADGRVRSPIRVGEDPTSIAAGLGAIWVGDEDGVIRRIDLETRRIDEILVGAGIRAIAVDEDRNSLWVDIASP
jgi:class 3 adenylate cyclase